MYTRSNWTHTISFGILSPLVSFIVSFLRIGIRDPGRYKSPIPSSSFGVFPVTSVFVSSFGTTRDPLPQRSSRSLVDDDYPVQTTPVYGRRTNDLNEYAPVGLRTSLLDTDSQFLFCSSRPYHFYSRVETLQHLGSVIRLCRPMVPRIRYRLTYTRPLPSRPKFAPTAGPTDSKSFWCGYRPPSLSRSQELGPGTPWRAVGHEGV